MMLKLVSFFLFLVSIIESVGGTITPTGPPPGNPGSVPIDDHIWLLLGMGAFVGVLFWFLIANFSSRTSKSQ